MIRRFYRGTFVIRHKDGDFVSGVSNGSITQQPDLLSATEFSSFGAAENVIREFTKADEYSLVRVHIKAVTELSGRKFAFNPRLKEVKATEKQYISSTQKIIKEIETETEKEMFWSNIVVFGVLAIPVCFFLYEVARRWGFV